MATSSCLEVVEGQPGAPALFWLFLSSCEGANALVQLKPITYKPTEPQQTTGQAMPIAPGEGRKQETRVPCRAAPTPPCILSGERTTRSLSQTLASKQQSNVPQEHHRGFCQGPLKPSVGHQPAGDAGGDEGGTFAG